MKPRRMLLFAAILGCVLLIASIAFADPLDDARVKLTDFLQKASLIVSGLIPLAGGLAIAALSVKRSLEKAAGMEEAMVRSSNQIIEVLKLAAIGTGASLLVSIAGMILR